MDGLTKFSIAWNIMWGLCYALAALFTPYIAEGYTWLYVILSIAILSSILCLFSKVTLVIYSGRICLFILAIIEVFGGITSWSGLYTWNVPFPNKEIFQVSMAFADLISAVFMFALALGD